MATNDEELKALDLENQGGEQEQEALKRAAQTDRVVRGVNGGGVPRARKLRPLAGIIVIALVVLAALYMRHGMANRNKKTTKQAETAKVGLGPATNVEKGLVGHKIRGYVVGELIGVDVNESAEQDAKLRRCEGGRGIVEDALKESARRLSSRVRRACSFSCSRCLASASGSI